MSPGDRISDAIPVSQRVVEEVAEATDTDPLELEPLHDSVDPDALDRLFDSAHSMAARNEGEISFPMAGCRVVVTADGRVEVDPDHQQAGATTVRRLDSGPSTAPESPD